MNPYDQAHALARALKESEEYREYTRLKETAYDDGTNKALLDEYKKLQFRLQAKAGRGREPAPGGQPAADPDRHAAAIQPRRQRLSDGGVPLSAHAVRHLQDPGRRGGDRPGHAGAELSAKPTGGHYGKEQARAGGKGARGTRKGEGRRPSPRSDTAYRRCTRTASTACTGMPGCGSWAGRC